MSTVFIAVPLTSGPCVRPVHRTASSGGAPEGKRQSTQRCFRIVAFGPNIGTGRPPDGERCGTEDAMELGYFTMPLHPAHRLGDRRLGRCG
ncbi:MAG: hypothetical protein VW644_12350, partial [Alphaproteobacteria bacterium]